MPQMVSTVLICLLMTAAVFFAGRKLWRDKKQGKTCCGGCDGCHGCEKEKKSKQ